MCEKSGFFVELISLTGKLENKPLCLGLSKELQRNKNCIDVKPL